MFALTDKAARERGLRIFAPERPGYGLSDFRRKDGLVQAADDLRWFADAVGLRRFALIGVSGGGPYAVAAAASMAERVALLALISPVGPIAECQSKIRMSKLHRFIFTKIGRSRQSGAAFFWSLRHVVRYAPDLAYRGLMQRVAPADRSVLLRGEVKANLQAALREGLRPGIAGARQDLRLFCTPWGLKLDGDRRADDHLAGKRRHHRPAGRRLSSCRDAAQLPSRCHPGRRSLLGVRRVPPRARRRAGRAARLAARTDSSSTCDSRRNLQQRAP